MNANDFNKMNYDRVSLMLPKISKSRLKRYLKDMKIRSMNSYIVDLIRTDMREHGYTFDYGKLPEIPKSYMPESFNIFE